MRRGCTKGAGSVACAVALTAWLVSSAASQVQAQAPARTVVLVRMPSDPELLSRVQGQTRDLAVELEIVPELPTSGPPTLLQARLTQGAAQLALWIDEPGTDPRYTITVVDGADGVPQVRSVELARQDAADALTKSAAFEQLAIVVRSELARVLTARREREQAERAAAAQAATAQTAAPTAPAGSAAATSTAADGGVLEPEESVEPTPHADRFHLTIVWDVGWVGRAHLAHAAAISGSVALGGFELGAGGALGFATTLRASSADARVARHALWIGAFYLPLPAAARLTLLVGARASLYGFARETRVHATDFDATPDDTSLAAGFGPELGLRLRLLPALGLALALRADLLAAAPRYVVQRAGMPHEITRARVLSPALSAGAFVAF